MDSGNSGSLQSSSGGDDELDAACGRGGADTSSPLSALLSHPGFGGSLIYGLQDLGAPPLSHWCATPAPFPPAGAAGASASPPSMPCHGGPAASAGAADQTATSTAAAQQPAGAAPPRGSRKRARASRRAPTTVLTTDTSNFRAMVQEFTGIPAPPFAAGASAARSRLDLLFPSRSTSAAAAAALPQYLLRPFAHKLHAYPPAQASAAIAAPAAAPVAPGDTYDHQQQQLTTAAPSALLGMQDHSSGGNSYLSFQSALGAQHDGKHPMFDDRGVAPLSATRRVQDPTDLGIMRSSEGTRGHGDRGDELSGLVGGCKATYSAAPPLMKRNGRSPPAGASTATSTTTAAMRTQGVDSWVCSTSE